MALDFSKKKFSCDYNNCPFRGETPSALLNHKRVHSKEKPFKCSYEDCKFSCENSSYLTIHERKHSGIKPFVCGFKECLYSSARSSSLKLHQKTQHNLIIQKTIQDPNIKKYKCKFENCEFSCKKSGDMTVHTKIHNNDRKFICDHAGCFFTSITSSNLKNHKKIHNNERNYFCDKCNYSCVHSSSLTTHKKIHTGERSFFCDMCDYSCITSGNLTQHKRHHNGERPYCCQVDNCSYKATRLDTLKRHKKSKHSEKGIQRQKKEEHKIEKILTENKILFEREVTVNFTCVLGNQIEQKSSRIDYVIHVPERKLTFLLEIDENQHKQNMISCETRRMVDTYTSLLATNTLNNHTVWLRYNPNAFKFNELRQKLTKTTREQELLKVIKTFVPSQTMEILYMFYDSRLPANANLNIPTIFDDIDFPFLLKQNCKVYQS